MYKVGGKYRLKTVNDYDVNKHLYGAFFSKNLFIIIKTMFFIS